jgi:hypothetical protein
MRPGNLERLVRDAIKPYIDRSLGRRLYKAELEADKVINEAWEVASQDLQARFSRVGR